MKKVAKAEADIAASQMCASKTQLIGWNYIFNSLRKLVGVA